MKDIKYTVILYVLVSTEYYMYIINVKQHISFLVKRLIYYKTRSWISMYKYCFLKIAATSTCNIFYWIFMRVMRLLNNVNMYMYDLYNFYRSILIVTSRLESLLQYGGRVNMPLYSFFNYNDNVAGFFFLTSQNCLYFLPPKHLGNQEIQRFFGR